MSGDEQALLEARARALARRKRRRADAIVEIVIFSLARATYAIELKHLRQVFPLVHLALLPGAQPPLVGVTAWRGELIRVLDLTRILDVPQGGPTDRNRVLVLGDGRAAFALLVDRILDVKELPEKQLTPSGARFVRGATADAVALLDGEDLIRTFAQEA
jgi:purine-binding chemotaxis protein CheW